METPDSPSAEHLAHHLTTHLTLLKIYALKLTGDQERASDLLQDTTIQILLHSDSYVYPNNFQGWATTIMYHLFLNEEKRRSRLHSPSESNVPEQSYLDRGIDLREINSAIHSLPQEYYNVFTLYTSGYKYHEISARLNIPIGTVKSRIHTARARLQLLLRDYVE